MFRLAISFVVNSCLPLFLIGGAVHLLRTVDSRRPCYHSTSPLLPDSRGQVERIPVLVHPSIACGRCHEGRGTRCNQGLVTVFPK